jgi:hypothetical protein
VRLRPAVLGREHARDGRAQLALARRLRLGERRRDLPHGLDGARAHVRRLRHPQHFEQRVRALVRLNLAEGEGRGRAHGLVGVRAQESDERGDCFFVADAPGGEGRAAAHGRRGVREQLAEV